MPVFLELEIKNGFPTEAKIRLTLILEKITHLNTREASGIKQTKPKHQPASLLVLITVYPKLHS